MLSEYTVLIFQEHPHSLPLAGPPLPAIISRACDYVEEIRNTWRWQFLLIWSHEATQEQFSLLRVPGKQSSVHWEHNRIQINLWENFMCFCSLFYPTYFNRNLRTYTNEIIKNKGLLIILEHRLNIISAIEISHWSVRQPSPKGKCKLGRYYWRLRGERGIPYMFPCRTSIRIIVLAFIVIPSLAFGRVT